MCSYCGCESIAIVGRFMAEHVALVNASGDLHRACTDGGAATVEAAARTLAGLLDPHTRAEEAGLFHLLRDDPEFTEYIAQLCDEHDALDAGLAAVVSAPDDASRAAAYRAFEVLLRGHIDREDNSLFPAAAIRFAGPEWDEVAALTPEP